MDLILKCERQVLWKELQELQINSSPWLLAGDFNTARFSNEKVGGQQLSFSKLRSFNDFISNCALSDLRSVGSTWSWNNKNPDAGRIAVRLIEYSATLIGLQFFL